MPNLIDKLINKVDTIRQAAANKFGLPAFDMYRVIRTWTSGIIGDGAFTDQIDVMYPTAEVTFKGGDKFEHGGRFDDRTMMVKEISLTYSENYLRGDPKTAGQECFYKMVERNTQGKDTTYWVLNAQPSINRGNINWELSFRRYTVC